MVTRRVLIFLIPSCRVEVVVRKQSRQEQKMNKTNFIIFRVFFRDSNYFRENGASFTHRDAPEDIVNSLRGDQHFVVVPS